MRLIALLVLVGGCGVRLGNVPDPRAFCQTAGWFVEGPRTIALHREATYRVKKCSTHVSMGKLTWSVSDDTVIRVLSSANDYAQIKAVQYGMADVIVLGDSGQYVLSVAVE